jgi:hypothetical protein
MRSKVGLEMKRSSVLSLGLVLVLVSAIRAQVIEGHFTSDGRLAAVKSCETFSRGGKVESRTAYWSVHSTDDPIGYFDYFVTYADGQRIQMEFTGYSGSEMFETRLFDPIQPERRFIHLKARESPDQCKGSFVVDFSTGAGKFSYCYKDRSSATVAANVSALLTKEDTAWLGLLARTFIAFAHDRQFRTAQLAFLQPFFDPHNTVRPDPAPTASTPCRYAEIRDEVTANFRPRPAIESAYQRTEAAYQKTATR